MKRIIAFCLTTLCISSQLLSQSGGNGVYAFLELPTSARQAALGTNVLASYTTDVALVLANPSLLDSTYHSHLSLNYLNYLGDVNTGSMSYAHYLNKFGSFAFSTIYNHYGTFTEADETGLIVGEFTASDIAFLIGWGRPLSPRFRIGANLKFIYSDYYLFSSTGLCVDVATSYIDAEQKFSTTLLIQNAGRQLKPYVSSQTESLPFRIHLTTQKQFQHVPLSLYFTFHNLQKWDLTYRDTTSMFANPFGNQNEQNFIEDIADKFMHHVIAGMEFSPFQHAYLRIGYNYHRRKEMIVPARLSTVGISWGFGFKIYKFHLSYARSKYHLSSTPNIISLTTKIEDWLP